MVASMAALYTHSLLTMWGVILRRDDRSSMPHPCFWLSSSSAGILCCDGCLHGYLTGCLDRCLDSCERPDSSDELIACSHGVHQWLHDSTSTQYALDMRSKCTRYALFRKGNRKILPGGQPPGPPAGGCPTPAPPGPPAPGAVLRTLAGASPMGRGRFALCTLWHSALAFCPRD